MELPMNSVDQTLSLAAKLLSALIRFYRKYISPLTPPSCRFHPTCSTYALEVTQRFGFLKGMSYIVRRLLKCHPWHPGGDDPVPMQGNMKDHRDRR